MMMLTVEVAHQSIPRVNIQFHNFLQLYTIDTINVYFTAELTLVCTLRVIRLKAALQGTWLLRKWVSKTTCALAFVP